jgi:hypothetical protein
MTSNGSNGLRRIRSRSCFSKSTCVMASLALTG